MVDVGPRRFRAIRIHPDYMKQWCVLDVAANIGQVRGARYIYPPRLHYKNARLLAEQLELDDHVLQGLVS